MQEAFKTALVDAVSFLKELPRERNDATAAYQQLKAYRDAHSEVRADLVIDRPPCSHRMDYDLLLGLPDESTVALSWRPDGGIPWNIEYADHWAANFVLTVNGWHTTIQQALSFLKFCSDRSPDLMTELVEQALITQAIDEDPPPVHAMEILAAGEAFRMANGFQNPAALNRWLEETGVSEAGFETLIRDSIQRRKLQARVTDNGIEPYFQAHRNDFEVVHYIQAETTNSDISKRLADAAANQNLLVAASALSIEIGGGVKASLTTDYAVNLSPQLAAAPTGSMIGPFEEPERIWLAQALGRSAARLDEATRAAIRKQLFRLWLTERREKATVRWHWF